MPRERASRQPADPIASQARAAGLLEFLAKKLVTNPENVVVRQSEGERGPIIELEVDPDDLGKVIGRGGRVAQALRTLVRASAEGRVIVDIVDVHVEVIVLHAIDFFSFGGLGHRFFGLGLLLRRHCAAGA